VDVEPDVVAVNADVRIAGVDVKLGLMFGSHSSGAASSVLSSSSASMMSSSASSGSRSSSMSASASQSQSQSAPASTYILYFFLSSIMAQS
jgi:hypothetical protein